MINPDNFFFGRHTRLFIFIVHFTAGLAAVGLQIYLSKNGGSMPLNGFVLGGIFILTGVYKTIKYDGKHKVNEYNNRWYYLIMNISTGLALIIFKIYDIVKDISMQINGFIVGPIFIILGIYLFRKFSRNSGT